MPTSPLPQCCFEDMAGRRCQRNGIGDPPFCRLHYEVLLRGRPAGAAPASVEELFGIFVNSPLAAELLDGLGRYVQRTRAKKPKAPPGSGYHTAWPPSPDPPRARQRQVPPSPAPALPDPRVILGFAPNQELTAAMVKKRRNELAAFFHPDKGGSDEGMRRINAAADLLISQLS